MSDSFDSYLTDDEKIALLSQQNGPDNDIKFLGNMNLVAYLYKGKFMLVRKSGGGFFPNEMEPYNEEFRKWLKEIVNDTTHVKFQ